MTAKPFEQQLRMAANKHDLISLRITDKRELVIPKIGLVKFRDTETNKDVWIDTSTGAWTEAYQKFVQHETSALNRIFTNNGIDNTLIYTDKDYVKPLMQLFKKENQKDEIIECQTYNIQVINNDTLLSDAVFGNAIS